MDLLGLYFIIYLQSEIWVDVQGLLEVFTECPLDHAPGSKALVTIVSDEKKWEAYAFCEPLSTNPFGDFEFVKMDDTVTRYLNVYFTAKKDEKKCIFMEDSRRSDVFQISIEVYTPFGDKFRSVSCVYQDHLPSLPPWPQNGTQNDTIKQNNTVDVSKHFHGTKEIELMHPHLSPAKKRIYLPKGGPARSNLRLYLVDIKHRPVGNRKWRFGRYLQLAVELVKPVGNEISFQVHDCMAKSPGQNQTHKLLDSGCGDSLVIPSDKGFTTTGRIAYSPPFKAFHLLESTRVLFLCSFYTCHTKCDGSSCDLQYSHRFHRDVEHVACEVSHEENQNESKVIKSGVGRKVLSPTHMTLNSEEVDEEGGDTREHSFSQADIYLWIGFIFSFISIVTSISLLAFRLLTSTRWGHLVESTS